MTEEGKETTGESKRKAKVIPNPRTTMQYTDNQQQFLAHLKQYPVPDAETIVNYVSTQGEDILENPDKLADALRETEISSVRRRQILKHWFAEKGIPITEKTLKKAEISAGVQTEGEDTDEARMRHQEKFAVNEETGAIRTASANEKSLTWDEAVKTAERIKKEQQEKDKNKGLQYVYDTTDRAIRMAKAGEQGGTLEEAKELKKMAEADHKDKGESPFTMGEDGKWQLVPGARLSTIEMMTWQSIQRANNAGEPIDPITEMTNYAEKIKALKDVFGGSSGIPDWMQDPEKFRKIMAPESTGESESVKALREKLDKIVEDQHKEETTRLQTTIQNLTTQVESYKTDISALKDAIEKSGKVTGKTAYDLIAQLAERVPKTSEMQNILQTIITNPPRIPVGGPADQTKRLVTAANALEDAAKLKKAGDAWFNLK
jgi:hypothetical protein